MLERLRLSPQMFALAGLAIGLLGALATVAIVMSGRDSKVIVYNDPTSFEIVVEIRGEVARPGVYRLPQDARLNDLVTAAGGELPTADLSAQNLARRLEDAEVVMISARGQATPVVAIQTTPSGIANGLSFRININTATALELETLPGIGPVIAERIVGYRLANGPYTAVEQLTSVEGISQSLLNEIETLITVGP